MSKRMAALVAVLAVAGSATAEAQFRSALTFQPRSTQPAPAPSLGVRGLPLLWGWGPLVDLDLLDEPAPPLPEGTPAGGVQLDVLPWRARVYVDGRYVGLVDDFNGYYQHLDASAGPHQIVIVEPGYQPLIVDLVVSPGRTTTYRGTLTEARRP